MIESIIKKPFEFQVGVFGYAKTHIIIEIFHDKNKNTFRASITFNPDLIIVIASYRSSEDVWNEASRIALDYFTKQN